MRVTPALYSLSYQLRRHWHSYVLGGLMLAAFQFSMNRIDWLAKEAIDTIFKQGHVATFVFWPAVWMLGLGIFAFVVRVASRRFVFYAGRDIEYDLRRQLLSQLHRLGTAFYRKMSTGEIMSRMTNDITQVRVLCGFGLMSIINVCFALPSALQVMLRISVRLTLVSLATLPLLLLITRLFASRLFGRNRENQEALGQLSNVVQSHVAGMRVVRSFALEEAEKERFSKFNRKYIEASLALARLRGAMGPIAGATSALGLLLFFTYGSRLLLKGPAEGGISSGSFFAFSLALARMTWPMISLGFVLAIVQRGRASYARLVEIFTAKPEVLDGALPAPQHTKGSLRVRDLSFSYGNKQVLTNLSFSVEAGRSVAIMGRTGAGKTTLAMLLTRLLPTPHGTVFIDETDVCDVPLSFVRSTIGYAQQDAFLFSTTVARNIGFSLDQPDAPGNMPRVQQAAQDAQLAEEMEHFPEQADTIVGERGVQLSGGQKQRVSLARALLWQPTILILDDPLSAVDAKTEAAILEVLAQQTPKRTLLLITHRVSAASQCDIVLVLDQGQVVQQGTHQQLLNQPGLYASFAEEQRAKNELEEMAISESEVVL